MQHKECKTCQKRTDANLSKEYLIDMHCYDRFRDEHNVSGKYSPTIICRDGCPEFAARTCESCEHECYFTRNGDKTSPCKCRKIYLMEGLGKRAVDVRKQHEECNCECAGCGEYFDKWVDKMVAKEPEGKVIEESNYPSTFHEKCKQCIHGKSTGAYIPNYCLKKRCKRPMGVRLPDMTEFPDFEPKICKNCASYVWGCDSQNDEGFCEKWNDTDKQREQCKKCGYNDPKGDIGNCLAEEIRFPVYRGDPGECFGFVDYTIFRDFGKCGKCRSSIAYNGTSMGCYEYHASIGVEHRIGSCGKENKFWRPLIMKSKEKDEKKKCINCKNSYNFHDYDGRNGKYKACFCRDEDDRGKDGTNDPPWAREKPRGCGKYEYIDKCKQCGYFYKDKCYFYNNNDSDKPVPFKLHCLSGCGNFKHYKEFEGHAMCSRCRYGRNNRPKKFQFCRNYIKSLGITYNGDCTKDWRPVVKPDEPKWKWEAREGCDGCTHWPDEIKVKNGILTGSRVVECNEKVCIKTTYDAGSKDRQGKKCLYYKIDWQWTAPNKCDGCKHWTDNGEVVESICGEPNSKKMRCKKRDKGFIKHTWSKINTIYPKGKDCGAYELAWAWEATDRCDGCVHWLEKGKIKEFSKGMYMNCAKGIAIRTAYEPEDLSSYPPGKECKEYEVEEVKLKTFFQMNSGDTHLVSDNTRIPIVVTEIFEDFAGKKKGGMFKAPWDAKPELVELKDVVKKPEKTLHGEEMYNEYVKILNDRIEEGLGLNQKEMKDMDKVKLKGCIKCNQVAPQEALYCPQCGTKFEKKKRFGKIKDWLERRREGTIAKLDLKIMGLEQEVDSLKTDLGIAAEEYKDKLKIIGKLEMEKITMKPLKELFGMVEVDVVKLHGGQAYGSHNLNRERGRRYEWTTESLKKYNENIKKFEDKARLMGLEPEVTVGIYDISYSVTFPKESDEE